MRGWNVVLSVFILLITVTPFRWDRLDAVVVASPVDNAFLDGLGLEVLGEGSASQGGEFVVRGEAEGDELFD